MPNPYGYSHRRQRARWKPTVEAGQAHCTEPTCKQPSRHIQPGTPWDLAHDRVNGGYHGPAHATCNRAEGARHRAALAAGTFITRSSHVWAGWGDRS